MKRKEGSLAKDHHSRIVQRLKDAGKGDADRTRNEEEARRTWRRCFGKKIYCGVQTSDVWACPHPELNEDNEVMCLGGEDPDRCSYQMFYKDEKTGMLYDKKPETKEEENGNNEQTQG